MSAKVRMNTEYRNKLYNRIKDVFEKEDYARTTSIYGSKRGHFNLQQNQLFGLKLARQVVERSYPKEDVANIATI